jgi:uncharacterized membrane protein YheB (UPF0754 family)
LPEFLQNVEFWKYLSIPLVAGLVGWFTNWVAIKLLFYPLEPFGKPPYFGWQGIIPSKAAKMGAITVDTTLSKLGKLSDVFQAMSPHTIAEHLIKKLEPNLKSYINWIMMEENPNAWKLLPDIVQDTIVRNVQKKLPETVEKIMAEVAENIEEMVDLKAVVIRQLVKDKRIVNRIFLECGAKEFRFIIVSGFYFGALFGLGQMVIWYYYPLWWVLPLFGILVGYATNWIALRIIFQPLNPYKIGPFVIQGLFLKRQKEVAEIWCEIVTQEIITVKNIIDEMLNGTKASRTHQLVRKHILNLIDEAMGLSELLVRITLGSDSFESIKENASQKAIVVSEKALDDEHLNAERARHVKELIYQRMLQLSPSEFQNLLRPAFQEEETKLIILGAILGLIAGMAQLYIVFGGI